jgi:hypothetical protein
MCARRATHARLAEGAGRREQRVRQARKRAYATVAAAKVEHARQLVRWRASRARWIAIAAAVFALACAAAAAGATARRRADARDTDWLADVVAASLGVGVAGYLCALLGAMLWADAWVFSWWLVGAAALGVTAAVAAIALSWRRPGPLVRVRTRLDRAAVPITLAIGAVAIAPAVAAAALDAPRPARFSATMRALAAAQRTHASMPLPVRRLRERAARLQQHAEKAQDRADAAGADVDALLSRRGDAQAAATRAERAITHWTDTLQTTQTDYDEFQQLLDDTGKDRHRGDDKSGPDGLDLGGDDSLDLDGDDGLDLGGDDGLDLGGNDTPGPAPTTEDFGSGSGSVGLCDDGTLSDSIGRHGACSHHGGVR